MRPKKPPLPTDWPASPLLALNRPVQRQRLLNARWIQNFIGNKKTRAAEARKEVAKERERNEVAKLTKRRWPDACAESLLTA